MDRCFEVIDLKSGNAIGSFFSEGDALASLRRVFGIHGPRANQDLSPMRITGDDRFVVAMGEVLEALVRRRSKRFPSDVRDQASSHPLLAC